MKRLRSPIKLILVCIEIADAVLNEMPPYKYVVRIVDSSR